MRLGDYEPPITDQPAGDLRSKKDDAIYTALSSAPSTPDVKRSYEEVLEELTRFDKSEVVDKLKADYEQNQELKTQQDASNVLLNTSLSNREKADQITSLASREPASTKQIFQNSVLGTNATNSFEGKRMQDLRAVWGGDTGEPSWYQRLDDTLDQGQQTRRIANQQTFLGNLKNMGADVVDLFEVFGQEGLWKSLKGTAEVGATAGTGIATMIGSGYAGIWKVATKDTAAADVAIKGIQEAAYKGDGRAYEAGMKVLESLGMAIDVPFKALGDGAYEFTKRQGGSDSAAAFAGATFYAVPQAFGYGAGGYAAIKAVSKGKGAADAVVAGLKAGSPLPSKAEPKGSMPADTMWVKVDSPITAMEQVNRPYAAEVLARAITSPAIADALGTTPVGIIFHNVLPKIGDDVAGVDADLFTKLQDLDAKAEHALAITKVDPWLFDPAAIKRDVDMHISLAKEQNELFSFMSSSTVNDTGRAYRGTAVYGKSENNGWVDGNEVMDARDKLIYKIAEKYEGKDVADMSQKERRAAYGRVAKNVDAEQLPSGEWVLKWKYNRYYDPADSRSMLLKPSANFIGLNVTGFANSRVGQWLFEPSSRLPKGITSGFARAEMRGTLLAKVWEDTMRNEILTTKPKKELYDLIIKGDEQTTHFSVDAIRKMYPNMEGGDFKSLVNGYEHYRRVDDQVYFTMNRMHRNKKITQGFDGLYDADGRYVGNLGREIKAEKIYIDSMTPEEAATFKEALIAGEDVSGTRTKKLVDDSGREALMVYDFTMKDVISPDGKVTGKEHTGPLKREEAKVDSRPVFKLDKPMTIDGHEYNFAIGVKGGQVPEKYLPKLPGHYTHINKEPYFIKATPKVLYVNGHRVDKDSPGAAEIYAQHTTTVAVAKTQRGGDDHARSLAKENPEFEYNAVVDRTDVDKGLETYLDAVKFGADLGKSRKQDRLAHADGTLSKLEDPAVALHTRYMQVAKLDAFKDIDFEFRQKYMERFGQFSDKKFPETAQDISITNLPATDLNQTLVKEARTMYEQYITYNKVQDSILDRPWREGMMALAYKLEEVAPKGAEAARWAATNKDPLFGGWLKLATVRAMHLNMQKQWLMQTSQIQEVVALATTAGNVKAVKDILNLGPRVFAALLTKSGSPLAPDGLKGVIGKFAHVGSGLSETEFKTLVDSFYDTGIPLSIDKHASLEGILRESVGSLQPTKTEAAVHTASKVAKAIPRTTKTLGFTAAELVTQIGLWLYSKGEFERLNPKAKYNDLHTLELISEKAWGLGNTMQTKGSVMPYQQGTLRAFLQFQAFSNKAAMQVTNSKFLSQSEKLRLAAIRTVAFGERGLVGAHLITAPLKEEVYGMIDPEDKETRAQVAEYFNVWEKGFYNKGANYLINEYLNNDTDPNLKADIAFGDLFGTTPKSGIPLWDFVKNVKGVWDGDVIAKDQVIAYAALSALGDTAAEIYNLYNYDAQIEQMDKPSIMKVLRTLAKYAPMWNNVEKAIVMDYTKTFSDKFGNDLEIGAATAEAWGQVFGAGSNKLTTYYDLQKSSFEIKKDVTETAKNIVARLHAVNFAYGQEKDEVDAYTEGIQREQILIAAYSKKDPALGKMLQKAVDDIQDKEEKKGTDTLVMRIYKSKADGWTIQEQINKDRLLQLQGTAGTDVTNALELLNIEIPEVPVYSGEDK